MPWFSYHSGHSGEFCGHAKDDLHAVIEAAIAAGFTHYGLSEHCPRYRDEDLYVEEIDAGLDLAALEAAFTRYAQHALSLREQYADRIELLVGFETERLPPGSWAERMRAVRSSAPFEYMVGSVHDVAGRYVDYKPELTAEIAAELGGREALHVAYFDAVADLVQTLSPEVVGHLDLVRKFDGPGAHFGPRAFRHIERALEAVRATSGVLDVNCGAHRRGLSPVYPLPSILERACAMGIGVTLGDDSHGVASVGVGLADCLRAIAAAGYRKIHYLARRDGVAQWCTAELADVRPRS
jgi:histidinol-phosphatase (PHP family)